MGSGHMTHNFTEGYEHEKDMAPKKTFAGRIVQHNSSIDDILFSHNCAYVLLSAKSMKLEKSNRKLKHASRKHLEDHDSDSNESDSS